MDATLSSAYVAKTLFRYRPGTTTLPSPPSLSDFSPPIATDGTYREVFLEIVERAGSGLALTDSSLRIREANGAFVEQCGHADGELLGLDFGQLLHPSIRQHLIRQFDRLIQRRHGSFVERLAALWATRPRFTGTVTGIAVRNEADQVETLVVLVSPDSPEGDHRVLISPRKIISKIDARILEGIAVGIPTIQLASRLYLSRQGVEYHVSNMLRQFKVPNRAALVSKAYSMGMLTVGSWPPKVNADYIRA
jgi:PAS domain S-box-containing protein